jgi:nicotinamide mononucleotide adenylyltransferase
MKQPVVYNMMCGRFQPFHLGHLNYLRVLIAKPQPFIIGITNPDPTTIRSEGTSEHRHTADANPFTFFERYLMVREVLRDEDVRSSRYLIVPFPVNVPELWRFYLPGRVVQHMPVFSEWEAAKAQRFRDLGHEVVVVNELAKRVSATDVRERIRKGEDWRELVPQGVMRVLKNLDLARSSR